MIVTRGPRVSATLCSTMKSGTVFATWYGSGHNAADGLSILPSRVASFFPAQISPRHVSAFWGVLSTGAFSSGGNFCVASVCLWRDTCDEERDQLGSHGREVRGEVFA